MPTPGLDGDVWPWVKPEYVDLAELARHFFAAELRPHAERLARQGWYDGVRTQVPLGSGPASRYGDRFAPLA